MKRRLKPALGSVQPVMTAAEVALALKCNVRTVHRLIKAGKLKAVQIGRDYRVTVDDYQAFLQTARKTPTERRRPRTVAPSRKGRPAKGKPRR